MHIGIGKGCQCSVKPSESYRPLEGCGGESTRAKFHNGQYYKVVVDRACFFQLWESFITAAFKTAGEKVLVTNSGKLGYYTIIAVRRPCTSPNLFSKSL